VADSGNWKIDGLKYLENSQNTEKGYITVKKTFATLKSSTDKISFSVDFCSKHGYLEYTLATQKYSQGFTEAQAIENEQYDLNSYHVASIGTEAASTSSGSG
jgi:hypothetical protein